MKMNIFNKINSALITLLLIFTYSCSPIEDRDELTNSFSPDKIQLETTQATAGGNKVSIKMATPGVTGYWDYILDQKFTNEVNDIIFPFTGEHTLTYHVTTPYMTSGNPSVTEYIQKSVKINITKLDTRLPDIYYNLVGQDLKGKTWVFDGTGGDERVWFAMTDPGNSGAVWWNAGGTCCPPFDVDGRMVFNVDGGLNITTYTSPTDPNPKKGTYTFNGDFSKLYIKGNTNILGSFNANGTPHDNAGNNGEFKILKLSESIMTLWVESSKGGTGWIWQFKAQ